MDSTDRQIILSSPLTGKLKHMCPTLYFTLTSWERHHLDTIVIAGLGPQQTISSSSLFSPAPLPYVVVEPFKACSPTPPLLLIFENSSHPPSQDIGGDLTDSTSNLPFGLVNLSTTSLCLINTSQVRSASLFSSTPTQGVDNIGITHLNPSTVEMLHLVPLPTYLSKSPIIDNQDTPSTSHCDFSADSTKKDFSWSRGLGLETSPIKTRSARRKAYSSVTLTLIPLQEWD